MLRRALALALMAAGPAGAQVVSEAPDAVAVTIYRDPNWERDETRGIDLGAGLALITETRSVEVPAGRGRIAFRGVADTIVAQTAAIEGLPGRLVERNQDYDLLSPGSLLEGSIGKAVRLVRTNPATGSVSEQRAIVRSDADGVMLEIDGRLEALRCSGLPERLVFEDVPAGLADKPTLSVLLEAPVAGRYTVRLSYLATGIAWSADYVARVRPDGESLDLTGWITLSNRTGATFAKAPTQVVAGDLSRDDDTRPVDAEGSEIVIDCWGRPMILHSPEAPAPMMAFRSADAPGMVLEEVVLTAQKVAKQSDLGDYKLYTLPEPTTVAARQTKQVLFLDEKAVPFERVYLFRLTEWNGSLDENVAPMAALRLTNTKARGLGKPLPAGVVSVTESGGRGPILAGEDEIEDAAVGLPVEIELGRAMGLFVEPKAVEVTVGAGKRRVRMAVDVENAKPAPVTLEYRHARNDRTGFRVVSASRRAGTKAGDPAWTLKLAPGAHQALTYTIEYDD